MKQLVALVMIAFLVPATATVAFAKNPCKEDKAKFCKDAKAAGKKVNDCLKEHIAEVTPACKEQLEKPKEPKTDKEKAERKIKKEGAKKDEAKPTVEKPAETKPAETKPVEPAPSESPPSPPAAPGGAEDHK
jgi:FtsZ-interacting cell division protein ZipA